MNIQTRTETWPLTEPFRTTGWTYSEIASLAMAPAFIVGRRDSLVRLS